MQVRIKSDVLLELTSNIVAYINDERKKKDNEYLDRLKKKYSRKERKILGFTIPQRTITDDSAIEIAKKIANKDFMGHWKSMWAWNVYNRAETLKAMCQAAESMAGDGWVKLHPKDIEILEWYDADWINQYLE